MEAKIKDEILDQVGQLIDDYEADLDKGFMAAPNKFKISFGVNISPEREAGKFKIVTAMSFSTEPKQPQAGQIKDKMEVIV